MEKYKIQIDFRKTMNLDKVELFMVEGNVTRIC